MNQNDYSKENSNYVDSDQINSEDEYKELMDRLKNIKQTINLLENLISSK